MKKYRNGSETYQLILENCCRLFYQQGYDATTLDDICKAANISRGLLYYHFGSKEAVFETIIAANIKLNEVQAVYYTGNLRLRTLMSSFIYWYKCLEDERYRACHLRAAIDGRSREEEIPNLDLMRFYYACFARSDVSFDDFLDEHRIDARLALGVEQQLSRYVLTYPDELNFIEVTETEFKSVGRLFEVSQAELDAIQRQAGILLLRIPFARLDTTLGFMRGRADASASARLRSYRPAR